MKSLKHIFLNILILSPLFFGKLSAQNSANQEDMGTRLGASFQKTVIKRVKAEGQAQFRLNNNFSQWSATLVDGGLVFKPFKKTDFTLKAGYRYYVKPDVNKNRIYVDAEYSKKIKPIRSVVSVRLRGQQDFSHLKSNFKIRSVASLSYNIPKIKWEPTASVEVWLKPENESRALDRIRLQLVMKYPVHTKINLKIGYFYQHKLNSGIEGADHVWMGSLSFDLDKSKKKKKKEKNTEKGFPVE